MSDKPTLRERIGRWIAGPRPATPASAPTPPAAPKRSHPPAVRLVRYDAAQETATDRNHWTAADDLSAASANSADVRQKLRRRSRYECANNGYLAGLLDTMAHDLIGSGPRLQLTVPGPPPDAPADALTADRLDAAAREVERAFAAWWRAARLTAKFRTLALAKWRDGEAFALFTTNDALPTPVKLDLRPVECDRVADPSPFTETTAGDGITYDAAGNPVNYYVLKNHPGDLSFVGLSPGDYDVWPARLVVHWFRCDRPGQLRGVPATTPMLPLGAQLRRYTLATLAQAEYAASVAGVLKTNIPAVDANGDPTLETFDEIDVVRGKLLTTPQDWDLTQLEAAPATSNYADFKNELLNEMGRPFCAPFNVIAGNSSGYNYSSGRLDHQIYHRAVWNDREELQLTALERVFRAWVGEADALGLIPAELPDPDQWTVTFHWDAFTSIDPLKDADADAAELSLGVTTLSELCAARGRDWREVADQRSAERAYLAARGLDPDGGAGPRPDPAADPAPADGGPENA